MAIHALKARYVFPVSGRPIENGLIGIEGQRIAAVGKHVSADTVEHLGNVAILPGLVNAHTHLEFSNLAKPLGNPGINFVDWLRLVIEYRRQMNSGDFTAIEAGLQECTRCGVTTIGAIAQPDCPLSLFENHSVDGAIYFELIAPTHERIRDIFGLKNSGFSGAGSEFISKINPELRPLKPEPWIESRTLNPEHSKWQRGLSPHAPYSVHLDLMQRVIDLSVHLQFPLAIHLAESREELQLLADGAGPLKEFLSDLDAYEPSTTGPGLRPEDYLQMFAVAARVLVVHGNYLHHDEIGLLADLAETMAVVFCPRTHVFFRNDRYPLEQMLAAGVNVCLGTDSRASSPDLSLLAEMRLAALQYPDLSPSTVLELGTLQGAKALGREHEIGSLQAGKYANLAVVPLPDKETSDPYELIFDSYLPVKATWFRGKQVFG